MSGASHGGSAGAVAHGGATGKAGMTGTGAVAGAPQEWPGYPPGTCVPLRGDPNALLIDNADDGNDLIAPQGKRLGSWFTFNDGASCTEVPVPMMPFTPVSGGALASKYTANITGSGCTMWGAGMGLDFNRNNDPAYTTLCAYDFGPDIGMSFYVKSTRPFGVYVAQLNTTELTFGGTCDPKLGMCSDHYQVAFPAAPSWTFKTIYFKNLTQLGFGQVVPFDPSNVEGLRFQVTKGATKDDAYELSIDELNFVLN